MLFLLFLLPFSLFASLDEGHVLASFEGPPEIFIENCVNAITGDLFLTQNDLTVEGEEPIVISQTYLSRLGWEKKGGWHFFPHTLATFDKEFPFILTVNQPNGTKCFFKPFPTPALPTFIPLKKKEPLVFELIETSHEQGLTNASHPFPSGQTNLMNTEVDLSLDRKTLYVTAPNGTLRCYRRLGEKSDFLRYVYQLSWEKLPNKNCINYTYDKNLLLKEVKTTNPSSTKTYAWVRFLHSGNKQTLETSTSQTLSYTFKTMQTIYEPLDILTAADGKETYSYDLENRPMLSATNAISLEYYKRHLNEVRGEQIEILSPYDLRLNRVKKLKTKSGKTYSFIYIPEEPGRMGGKTIVYDNNGNKIVFEYSKKLRLEEVHYFEKKEETYLPTNGLRFFWKDSRLICKMHLDGERKPLSAMKFEYDQDGNVIKEHHYLAPIDLNAQEMPDNPYKTITRNYSKDRLHLLLKEESQKATTHYNYLPGTNLPVSIFSSNDGQIEKREFFFYDEEYLLTKSISDDGSSEDMDELTN